MGFARVEPFLRSKGRTEGSRDQIILPQRGIMNFLFRFGFRYLYDRKKDLNFVFFYFPFSYVTEK